MGELLVRDDFKDLYGLLSAYPTVYVVYDRNVECFAEEIISSAKVSGAMAIDAAGTSKNIDTVLAICRFLLDHNADRKAMLLAVGGGTTTDMVGFAASIYKRGVHFGFVPTTLLAQVDASIGGKTGVNLDGYKNILGTFSFADFTYSCPKTLSTLTLRDLRSGYAEMLKSFMISSKENYESAVALLPEITPGSVGRLTSLIMEVQQFKTGVVSRDPFEKGERRCLNLGHTYGHAVEWWEQANNVADPHTHGEAVAIGLVMAATVSEREGYAPRGLAEAIGNDLQLCGLPVSLPCPESELVQAISKDKKNEDGKVKFVYIKKIGETVWSV